MLALRDPAREIVAGVARQSRRGDAAEIETQRPGLGAQIV
jgi:hypothetical protein